MPKKKHPNFVTEEETTFALNRPARRLARRKGWSCVSVPMPTLLVSETGSKRERKYFLQHITGELVDYTPYYDAPKRKEKPTSIF